MILHLAATTLGFLAGIGAIVLTVLFLLDVTGEQGPILVVILWAAMVGLDSLKKFLERSMS